MAEVTTILTTGQVRDISKRGSEVTRDFTRRTVTVRSLRADKMDVSVLLDFADAVREAGISGRALLRPERSPDGQLVQLKVEESKDVEPDPPAAKAEQETPVAGAEVAQ